MNTILCTAHYVGEVFTETGLRFIQVNIPGSGKTNVPAPLFLIPNKAAGDTFDAFSEGCNLIVSGRLYPNRNDYKMYVVPNQPLQVVTKDVTVNQVNLAGGVGYIGEQKKEDLFTFSLMVKAPSQPLLNHTWQDSMGFRIESWGDDSRRLGNLLYIGRQMAMLGSLRYNAWQTPEGEKRGSYQVRAKASQYSVFGKNQQKDIPSIDIADKPASVTTVLESEPPF
jgi:hypothetical protein